MKAYLSIVSLICALTNLFSFDAAATDIITTMSVNRKIQIIMNGKHSSAAWYAFEALKHSQGESDAQFLTSGGISCLTEIRQSSLWFQTALDLDLNESNLTVEATKITLSGKVAEELFSIFSRHSGTQIPRAGELKTQHGTWKCYHHPKDGLGIYYSCVVTLNDK